MHICLVAQSSDDKIQTREAKMLETWSERAITHTQAMFVAATFFPRLQSLYLFQKSENCVILSIDTNIYS